MKGIVSCVAVNIGCQKHTGCYKAVMKREGILTDCRFFFFCSFFASVKRETVNISAGVFSLSKASRSKVKFTISSVALATNLRYGGFFLSFLLAKLKN